MGQEPKIKVTVNMPATPEGKAALHEAIVKMNSYIIGRVVSQSPMSYEQKHAFLRSLNGVAPWANGEQQNKGGQWADQVSHTTAPSL